MTSLRSFLKYSISCFLFALLFFGISSVYAAGSGDFVITIDTTKISAGSTDDITIKLPTTGAGYNFQINRGDNSTGAIAGSTPTVQHTYASGGVYQIRISGAFPRIYFNNVGDKLKILSIDQWGTGSWTNMQNAFYGAENLVINATDAPILTTPATMSLTQMFRGAISLVDNGGAMSTWNTSKVNSMASMFYGATNFNGDISNWNTSNVTNMANMFTNAKAFNQPLDSWVTNKVTNFNAMFQGASGFNQDLNNWITSGGTNMANMFNSATTFNGAISNWDTSKVTVFNGMFQNARDFNQDVSSWNTSSGTNMSNMFNGADNFNSAIGNWNTSNVTTMASMFANTAAFNQPIGSWDTSKVTTIASMFQNASSFNQDLNNWNTSNVNSMASTFQGATNFNGAIGNWNTSKVTTFHQMFREAASFNQPIGNWITSSGTTMYWMFGGDTSSTLGTIFNQPIGNWDTSNVTTMYSMFWGNSEFNQDISGWDVSRVKDMRWMFGEAHNFNQPIGGWNTSGATNMHQMFRGAVQFNQDIGSWDVSNVKDMAWMFNTSANTGLYMTFNQDIGGWDTSSVTTMQGMFMGDGVFDQNLGGWNVSSLTTAEGIFARAKLSVANYDALLSGWNTQTLLSGVNFDGGDSQYCFAQAAHENLFNGSHGWILEKDGGNGCITALYLSNTEINENSTSIGTFSIDTLLSGGIYTYTLTGGTGADDNNLFVISGNQLSFIVAPDYENPQDQGDSSHNNTYSIRVLVQDGNGSVLEKIFIITVKDVSENTTGGNGGSRGGGGGGSGIDSCPQGDYSPSQYDRTCGTPPTTDNTDTGSIHTDVDTTIFNPSIGNICFTPLNKKTIDQGIQVSELFKIAHQMLYSYTLTKWQGTKDYRPFDFLTRQEASRFMVEFAQNVLCRKPTKTYDNKFIDIEDADYTLLPYIQSSYEYGIFKGGPDGSFRPHDIINQDEIIAVMVRLVTNKFLPEEGEDWAKEYRLKYSSISKHPLEDTTRGSIAQGIYSLYKDNTYTLQDVGYVAP